jgi:hypothetical protein
MLTSVPMYFICLGSNISRSFVRVLDHPARYGVREILVFRLVLTYFEESYRSSVRIHRYISRDSNRVHPNAYIRSDTAGDSARMKYWKQKSVEWEGRNRYRSLAIGRFICTAQIHQVWRLETHCFIFPPRWADD